MRLWPLSKQALELDEAVRSTAKVATRWETFQLKPGETQPIVGTKFGGNPYAEAGDAWPMFRDRPYDFLVQFDFRECYESPIAAYDLITVYVSWHALELLENADADDAYEQFCLIRTFRDPSPEKAIAMAKPPSSKGDYRITTCAAKPKRVLTYPSPMGNFQDIPAIAEKAKHYGGLRRLWVRTITGLGQDPSKAEDLFAKQSFYIKSLKRLGYHWRDDYTQVGGYATWVHDNTLEYDDLVFIAQVVHEPHANYCVGDAAPLFIAAHANDPTKFKFDAFQTH